MVAGKKIFAADAWAANGSQTNIGGFGRFKYDWGEHRIASREILW